MKRVLCLLLLAGCLRSFGPMPQRELSPLPSRDERFDGSAERKRSAVSGDLEFDRQFRANVRNYGDLEGVHGVDQLRFPQSWHPDGALAYIRLGDAAIAARRWGAASQAYWAALGITSKTIGSRRQREELRRATYLGLSRIAAHKRQTEWAALLQLCAGLADTYISSEIAETHHDDFYSTLEAQLRAQRRAEEAEARARRGIMFQRIAAGLSVAATVAGGASGALSQSQVNAQAAQIATQLSATEEQARELDAAMQEAMGVISTSVGQLREIAASDIPDIQTGRTFVARQVAWYLLSAPDPLRYFDGPLAAFAKGRPPVRRAIEAARAAFASAPPAIEDDQVVFAEAHYKAVADLALAVMAVEQHVALHERNRVVPMPDYVGTVCGPTGGAIECFMAAGDLCRAGIEEGCSLLAAIAREAR